MLTAQSVVKASLARVGIYKDTDDFRALLEPAAIKGHGSWAAYEQAINVLSPEQRQRF